MGTCKMMETNFTLDAAEFLLAVSNSRKIRRSPVGGRSKIPRDTLITPDDANQIVVETPLMKQKIEINGTIAEQISVGAEELEKIVKALQGSGRIRIWVQDKMVFLEGSAKFSMPFYDAK